MSIRMMRRMLGLFMALVGFLAAGGNKRNFDWFGIHQLLGAALDHPF
ncbi:hypothetical protein [Nonomuraea sp. NEAU-A123]|nr:hypothetical protein [Nonomuraea sp. NEAU-A123]MBT2232975.1 hypothetical protein [Nonomuraea sp. NEAU-A123]